MKLYLAGPFFTPPQKELIGKLEDLVRLAGFRLFSPRLIGGILPEMRPEERAGAIDGIFQKNVEGLFSADVVLAVIDDRDPGTIWEIGFSYARRLRDLAEYEMDRRPKIVTFTDHRYGVNVMVQKCVDAHCRGLTQAARVLQIIKEAERTDAPPDLSAFHDFSAETT